ncbi:hypothetical protein SUGI_0089070 [Cryptomeria japonica]|nr:hypothetical protein SUGI_0089070 [Cryptomeria japonica]
MLDSNSLKKKKGLETEPATLWNWYLDWLYQHKELRLYINVSRMGFTNEFMEAMKPKFQSAFKALEELEAGSIANPDEGRIVGHYWLTSKCEFTLNLVLEELQKNPWATLIDARAARCANIALGMVVGLVGACVPGTAT